MNRLHADESRRRIRANDDCTEEEDRMKRSSLEEETKEEATLTQEERRLLRYDLRRRLRLHRLHAEGLKEEAIRIARSMKNQRARRTVTDRRLGLHAEGLRMDRL